MGTTKGSQVSSDRQKWDKIFNGLVKMLQTQQEQLETLVQERKFLEDRIKMQHDRWVSDIRLYEDHVSQMKGDLETQEMARLLEAAKSDLMMGLKHRAASLFKLKLETTEDEFSDFKAWFGYLSRNPKRNSIENSEGKAVGRESDPKFRGSKKLEGEVSRLKLECEKLASEKNSEISSLLAEKKFVWHQYGVMEKDLTDKLKSKCAEVEQANEKIVKLLASMEQLQSSNNEKDEIIARLETKLVAMEADKNKQNEEISRLSRELELSRKSGNASVTPVLNHCTAGARTSSLGGKNVGRGGSNIVVKKELPAAQVPDLVKDTEKGGSRSLKRKGTNVISILETPKLFTNAFKVPKLKISSPPVR